MSIAVARKASNTAFTTLHEPFQNGEHSIATFERIAQDERAIAARVRGRGQSTVNDRLMVRFDDKPERSVTLTDEEESFTFRRHPAMSRQSCTAEMRWK